MGKQALCPTVLQVVMENLQAKQIWGDNLTTLNVAGIRSGHKQTENPYSKKDRFEMESH